MLWSDFIALVNDDLGVDAGRRGITNLLDRSARNAVLDLQRYIRAYRQGQTTTYTQSDLTVETDAMVGTLPTGAIPKAFYIYSTATGDDPNCRRHRLDYYPWDCRKNMICGRVNYRSWCPWPGFTPPPNPPPPPPAGCQGWWWASRPYLYSISPMGRNFVIYPPLNDSTNLLLVWDGLKQDFANGDSVPFPSQAAEAVAMYTKWKIQLQVDKNVTLAHEYQAAWSRLRLALYREAREAQMADGKDEEYTTATSVPPAGAFNSYHTQANSTGNSEISPTSGDHIEDIAFSGAASTRVAFVDTNNRASGDRCTILATFPATAGIVVQIRNGSPTGTVLYTYTSDGSGNSAAFELYFANGAWQPLRVQVPA